MAFIGVVSSLPIADDDALRLRRRRICCGSTYV